MNVEQLMTRAVFTCGAQDTLNKAAEILWEKDIGCVPVLDGASAIAGILTDRDICMAAYTQGGPLKDLRVSSAMSRNVLSCKPDDPIAVAEGLMKANRVRRLPVLDDEGCLVGLLSLNDIVREAAREREAGKKDLSDAEVRETLAAVCEPRVEVVPHEVATASV